jgi:hypothetical protein
MELKSVQLLTTDINDKCFFDVAERFIPFCAKIDSETQNNYNINMPLYMFPLFVRLFGLAAFFEMVSASITLPL